MPLFHGIYGSGSAIQGNAVPSDVLASKTFMSTNSPSTQTGTMANKKGQTVTALSVTESGSNVLITVPETGCYDTTSKLSVDKSLLPNTGGNIVGGLFGSYKGDVYYLFVDNISGEEFRQTSSTPEFTSQNFHIKDVFSSPNTHTYTITNNSAYNIKVINGITSDVVNIDVGQSGNVQNTSSPCSLCLMRR